MKILILNHNLSGHGTYHRAWPVARGLAQRGWDVTFATVSARRKYRQTEREEEGVRVIESPQWTWPGLELDDGWGPLAVRTRKTLVWREKFDWVYSFAHPPVCSAPALLGKKHGAKLAYDWCDDYADGIFPQREALRNAASKKRPLKWRLQRMAEKRESALETLMAKDADKVTVIGRALRQKTLDAGVNEDRIRLVRSGADLEFFAPRPREEARRQLGLPLGKPLMVYMANYHPDERFLIDTLEKVLARCPDAQLAYTGPALVDPPIASRLIHLGRLDWEQVPLAIAAGDVSVLPMDDTPHNRARCPQKLMDYLASGRPIATCAVGEVEDLFRENRGIGIASEPTALDFADSICRILEMPQNKRDEMGRAARQAAEARCSWDRVVDEIDRFLRD